MAKVQDPVCGMMIDEDTAPTKTTFEGATYYFCSAACREQFGNDPSKYVAERHEPRFTTAMGIPAPKFGSAGSGGAEYELTPEAHSGRKH